MLNSLFSYFCALPLLLAGGREAFSSQRILRDRFGGMACVAWVGTKFWISAELRKIFEFCDHASLLAMSAGSVWVGMLAFGLSFSLMVSGTADLLAALSLGLGRAMPTPLHRPFGAARWTDFWQRWGTQAPGPLTKPAFKASVIRCTWFLLSVLLWAGYHSGMGPWLILQVLLMRLDSWLDRLSFWQNRVPHAIQSLLIIATFVLSLPLLYSGGVEEAAGRWLRLFSASTDTLYSLLLEARLTTPRVSWLLGLAAALVLMPDAGWLWRQSHRWQICIKVTGFILGGMILLALSPSIPWSPQPLREGGLHLRRALYADGNEQVCIGSQGWLYPQKELERFIQTPAASGLTPRLLELLPQLQAQGIRLLLLPVPDKIMLQPEALLPATYDGPIYPPGYHASMKSLVQAGVDVFDLTEQLWEQRHRRPLHFRQDSHWRWEGMKEMTVQLARHLRERYPAVFKNETPLINASFMERQDIGDLARALQSTTPLSRWTTETTPLVGLSGLAGEQDSPVLVIGGDLIHAYDDPELSFGPENTASPKAAFPIQLGALVGNNIMTLDSENMPQTLSYLAGKKLVIWIARVRDL